MFNIVGAIVFCTGIAIVMWLFSGATSAREKVADRPRAVSVIELEPGGEYGSYR